MATVRAENVDRAARRRHRALDRGEHGAVPATTSAGASVVVVDERVQLLPEPRHHQESVVDREPEPEHGDDVDDRRVEVDGVGEREQRRQPARDRGDGAGHGHGGGEEPPNTSTMMISAIGRAIASPVRRSDSTWSVIASTISAVPPTIPVTPGATACRSPGTSLQPFVHLGHDRGLVGTGERVWSPTTTRNPSPSFATSGAAAGLATPSGSASGSMTATTPSIAARSARNGVDRAVDLGGSGRCLAGPR